ncbi:MAG: DUF624 domain-containing protein [Defluviitaleaceae bacterium]|nr:DUF624 domain-containing protein [Defluviitaleaceae bacterium]
MSGFFSLDGPFYKYGSLVADIMILSVAWIVCSIPLVTAGASTAAIYFVATRRIANREGYILRDFWAAFKANFKRATILWIIMVALGLLLINNIIFFFGMSGTMASIMLPIEICLLIELVLISFYVFPITARFDMNVKTTLKTAFYMANRHLPTSLTIAVLFAALILAILFMSEILILAAPGLFAWLSSYMLIRIFKKYRPEMDKDPIQELAEIEAALEAGKDTLDEFQKLEFNRIEAGEAREEYYRGRELESGDADANEEIFDQSLTEEAIINIEDELTAEPTDICETGQAELSAGGASPAEPEGAD